MKEINQRRQLCKSADTTNYKPQSGRIYLVLLAAIFLCSTASTAIAQTPLKISYKLAKSQKVSLNVYDAKGQIVRELLHTSARTAGNNTEQWDGRDDAGAAVPAGSYTWKMLAVPGFGAEYITSPGGSYPAGEGFNNNSPGSHGGPSTIAVDSSGFYVGSGSENIEITLAKSSLDGSAKLWGWGNRASFTSPVALTLSGNTLWTLYPDGNAYRNDATTAADISPAIAAASGEEKPTDMAASASTLVFSYPKVGLVRWLDLAGKEIRSVAVPGASTVDLAADGAVYVTSGTSMLKIAPGATSATALISGLVGPRRAAVNPTNGEIYIADMGQWSNGQIKRFSSDGKLLQDYGAVGGRALGLYQDKKQDFSMVADIAVEADGKFWVVEEAVPRRTARFNKDGTWIKEWYGGQHWAPFIMPEPDNPRYVWIGSSWGSMMRVYVDYEKKYWRVHSTYSYYASASNLIGNHHNGATWEARVRNGVLYLCRTGSEPQVIKVDRAKWTLVPAAVGVGHIAHYLGYQPEWLQALYKQDAANRQSLLWMDANGDGRPLNADGTPQMSELQFSAKQAPWISSSSLDSDVGYMSYDGNNKGILRWKVTGWNASGSPIFGTYPTGEIVASKPPRQTGNEDGRWTAFLTSDLAGNIWGAFNPNITGWGSSSDSFLARWNRDGTLAWQSGRNNGKAGSLGTLRRMYGVINNGAGSNALVVGRFSHEWPSEGVTPIYVYDQDGLYAGLLINKFVNQGDTPNTRYGLGAEALSGQIVKHSDGQVYFFGNWLNEGRVFRITGWDGWQRASGKVMVPAGYAAPAFAEEPLGPRGNGTGLQAMYYATGNWTGEPVISRVDPQIDFTWNNHHSAVNTPIEGKSSYSVVWTGYLTPRRTGWHMFSTSRGIGGNILVNNVIVDRRAHGGSSRILWLEAGKQYPIRVNYTGAPPFGVHPVTVHGIVLQWVEPETNNTWVTIPQSQLSPESKAGAGVKAQK